MSDTCLKCTNCPDLVKPALEKILDFEIQGFKDLYEEKSDAGALRRRFFDDYQHMAMAEYLFMHEKFEKLPWRYQIDSLARILDDDVELFYWGETLNHHENRLNGQKTFAYLMDHVTDKNVSAMAFMVMVMGGHDYCVGTPAGAVFCGAKEDVFARLKKVHHRVQEFRSGGYPFNNIQMAAAWVENEDSFWRRPWESDDAVRDLLSEGECGGIVFDSFWQEKIKDEPYQTVVPLFDEKPNKSNITKLVPKGAQIVPLFKR